MAEDYVSPLRVAEEGFVHPPKTISTSVTLTRQGRDGDTATAEVEMPQTQHESMSTTSNSSYPTVDDTIATPTRLSQTHGSDTLATPPITTQARDTTGQSPILAALYVDTLVAFAPVKEGWITTKKYVGVGNAYIVGRVCRIVKGSYQVRWLDSQFQSHVEPMTLSTVQRGHTNYTSLHGRATGPGWRQLFAVDPGERVQINEPIDTLEQFMETFDPPTVRPSTVAEVETMKNFRFEPESHLDEPEDLFCHEDTTTTTRLKPEYRYIFEHSASSSIFAYIPVYFWQQVVGETNTYARVNGIALGKPFTLEEIMAFLGILFYMALVDKGEIANYWGAQVEDAVFGGNAVGLDNVMKLKRFKLLRQAFTFQCVAPSNSEPDQAARIRPLLNLLKSTGSKYVDVGRNVALDEASITCRSKYGKPLIVYNPMKPGGKYHFRIYMLCCATSWISLNFRLHCESAITDRRAGVTTVEEAVALDEELSKSSAMRQCVLEVVRPLYGTRRIVNSDNYYTSVKLLEALRVKGLYGRGTVRKSSAHFPQHVLIEKKKSFQEDLLDKLSPPHTTLLLRPGLTVQLLLLYRMLMHRP